MKDGNTLGGVAAGALHKALLCDSPAREHLMLDACVFHLVSGGRQGSVLQRAEKGERDFSGTLIWTKERE